MSNLIDDGPRKIVNVKFPDLAFDLSYGQPLGLIVAYTYSSSSTTQTWVVKNLGSNQIILRSSTVADTYASVYSPTEAAGLTGSPNPTIWTIQEGSSGKYRLVTPDGKYSLYINYGGTGVPIRLGAVGTRGDGELWTLPKA